MIHHKRRTARLRLVELLEDRMLLSAGDLDPSFGTGGKVTSSFLGPTDSDGRSVVIQQPDGKIVVAGTSFSPTGADFALARYNTNGSLDTTFGSGGTVATDFGGFEFVGGAAIETVGGISKIVVVGGASFNGPDDFALARYNLDGSLDASFGTGGKVTTNFTSDPFNPFNNSSDLASSVAIQSDGKIVVAGGTSFNGPGDFALARYNTNGSLDDGSLADSNPLDSFGTGGKVTTNFTSDPFNTFNNSFDQANGVAIQSDGKIVAAGVSSFNGPGDFALARYNMNGSLDDGSLADSNPLDSFGTGGKVTTNFTSDPFNTSSDQATSVAIQSDGKIVAAGGTSFNAPNEFALARYNMNGSLDGTFGTGGEVTTDFTSGPLRNFSQANGVAIQSNGKIVAAGTASTPSEAFALARYNTNGSLDTTFGTGGEVTTRVQSAVSAIAQSMALQSDGKIVVAGSTGSGDFALARYKTDGSLDTTFGTGGRVTTDFGSFDQASSVAIQSDGKIVVVGTSNADFALARYNTNGSLDTGFGIGGKVTTDFASTTDQANSVAIQSDGKIVVVGDLFNFSNGTSDFALARYNKNGSVDTSFGQGGKLVTGFASNGFNTNDVAQGVAIQGDGKIVVVGTASGFTGSGFGSDIALARYNPNGILDTGFDKDGKVTTSFGPATQEQGFAVVIQSNGRIVVAGSTAASPGADDFALVRYKSNGSLDTSFGQGGLVATDFFGTDDVARSIALQSDGKIVVAGSISGILTPGTFDFALGGMTPTATSTVASVRAAGSTRISPAAPTRPSASPSSPTATSWWPARPHHGPTRILFSPWRLPGDDEEDQIPGRRQADQRHHRRRDVRCRARRGRRRGDRADRRAPPDPRPRQTRQARCLVTVARCAPGPRRIAQGASSARERLR